MIDTSVKSLAGRTLLQIYDKENKEIKVTEIGIWIDELMKDNTIMIERLNYRTYKLFLN